MIEIDEIISNKTEDRLSLKRILEEDPSLKQEIGWDDSADDENVEWVRTIKAWTPAKDPEQEPCEDTISRQAAIDAFERFIHELGIEDEPYNYGEMALSVKNVPPVKPQPKTGHWLRMSDLSEQEDDRYKCSCCGNVVHYIDKMNLYTFNSWCGRCGSDNGRHINYEVEE